MKDGIENAFKNHVCFGISIWKGFGEGFGRVLGHQNPRFSRFFRCFLEVIFEARSGGVRNRPEKPPSAEVALFCLRFPVIPPPPGERKREGIKSLGLHNELGFSDSPSVMGQSVSESDELVV